MLSAPMLKKRAWYYTKAAWERKPKPVTVVGARALARLGLPLGTC